MVLAAWLTMLWTRFLTSVVCSSLWSPTLVKQH
uniref:Uncharacterized protein n=1 Tax=Arundo donax TaxID=35708 RepID=A0A0A9A5Z0_ARUDO